MGSWDIWYKWKGKLFLLPGKSHASWVNTPQAVHTAPHHLLTLESGCSLALSWWEGVREASEPHLYTESSLMLLLAELLLTLCLLAGKAVQG